MKRDLLIIDDEMNMRHMLEALLTKNGYRVVLAENGFAGYQMVQEKRFDFILCDIRMPEMDGMEFLNRAKQYLLNTTVIMMSAYSSIDLALEAIKQGAYDFISKPFKIDEVLLTLKKAEERELLKQENCQLKEEISTIKKGEGFESMVGGSEQIQELFALARKVSQYDSSVLITGESGTGKELFARGVHKSGPRHEKSFVAVNCGSFPAELLESEFFGYIKGSFTGAESDRRGLFEEAHNGTLFLDEIGELPFALQVKFLRVLQEGEIRPVGALQSKKINVRIIAATAKDLDAAVLDGTFRKDLFYRLNVVTFHLPPLRDRKDDIPSLATYFLKKINRKFRLKIDDITPNAMQLLMRHDWPGNVRELENTIERAAILSNGHTLNTDAFKSSGQDREGSDDLVDLLGTLSLKKARKIVEGRLITSAMQVVGGNKSKASEILEISYPSLLNKIKEYNVN